MTKTNGESPRAEGEIKEAGAGALATAKLLDKIGEFMTSEHFGDSGFFVWYDARDRVLGSGKEFSNFQDFKEAVKIALDVELESHKEEHKDGGKVWDATLKNEDYVKWQLGKFLDGLSSVIEAWKPEK